MEKINKFTNRSSRLIKKLDVKAQIANETESRLADEIIELVANKEGLTYMEVYAALDLAYEYILAQSAFANFKLTKDNSTSSSSKNG